MKIKTSLLFLIGTLFLLFDCVDFCFASEPKLLWKKDISDYLSSLGFARESGDVIFVHGENKNKIDLIDRNGIIRWQWGPDLELCVTGVSISDNGRLFVFKTEYQLEVHVKKGYKFKDFIHYYESSKGELWRIERGGLPYISPNGEYIFIGIGGGEGGPSLLLDSGRKRLWEGDVGEIENILFSRDSNYIAYSVSEFSPIAFLLNIPEKSPKEIGRGDLTSISQNGGFIGLDIEPYLSKYKIAKTIPPKGGIYNKDGNLIYEGINVVSEDGKRVINHFQNRIEIVDIQSKSKIYEYPIQSYNFPNYVYRVTCLSKEGRYVAAYGKRTDKQSPDNLFIIDSQEGTAWQQEIEQVDKNSMAKLFLTIDRKYLLVEIRKINSAILYYFQTY